MITGNLKREENTAYIKINNELPNEDSNFIINAASVGLGSFEGLTPQTLPISTEMQIEIDKKQNELVSGTDIKTINGQSLLGEGNIDLSGISFLKVDTLPATGENNIIYLLANGDVYDEYIYLQVDNKWEVIGNTSIDLSGYALKSELPTLTSQLSNDSNFPVDADYVHTDNNFTTEEKTKLEGLSNYDDSDVLKFVEQTLTEAEQEQVKQNLDIAEGEISERITFDTQTIVENKITFTHNRNSLSVIVSVYDNNNQQVLPTNVDILSVSQIQLDLTNMTTEGIWSVVIQGGKAVIGGIEPSTQNAVLYTEQILTEEQKAQVKINLSLSDIVVEQGVGESTTNAISQAALTELLNGKVSIEAGKGLSSNDFTTVEKDKLNLLTNYNDTTVKADITALQNNKADKSNTYTKTEVDAKVSSALIYKGSLETKVELDAIIEPKIGDMYNVLEDSTNYAWNGTVWGVIGGVVDLSPYATNTEVDAIRAELLAMINEKLDANVIKLIETEDDYNALTTEEKLNSIAFVKEV